MKGLARVSPTHPTRQPRAWSARLGWRLAHSRSGRRAGVSRKSALTPAFRAKQHSPGAVCSVCRLAHAGVSGTRAETLARRPLRAWSAERRRPQPLSAAATAWHPGLPLGSQASGRIPGHLVESDRRPAIQLRCERSFRRGRRERGDGVDERARRRRRPTSRARSHRRLVCRARRAHLHHGWRGARFGIAFRGTPQPARGPIAA